MSPHVHVLDILHVVLLIITSASIAYSVLATIACVRFASRRNQRLVDVSANLPPISILKPLKGDDPGMYAALRSHCEQDYPEYEILFGIADERDPADAIVRRLIREFPNRNIRIVRCDDRIGANGKVSSLIQLAAVASYEYLLVNDSDIRIEAGYLRTVIGELQPSNVGLVTCLYRGVPAASVGSRLEAIGIASDFVPGVLTADLLEGGLHFGLGSTLAFRKTDLHAIGGFEAIVDYLADDYELGARIAKLGRKVQLSRMVVETNLPVYTFAEFWAHQLRWSRTIRASRPGGYAGLLITFTSLWMLATVLVWPSNALSWILLATASLVRVTAFCISYGRVLKHHNAMGDRYFLIPHDLLAPVIWLAGWFGNSILWRGEKFTLQAGKLTPLRMEIKDR